LSSWETRLIKLLPGDFDEPLRCDLHVAAITIEEGFGISGEPKAVEYEGLSYPWGRADRSASIECDGMPEPVPPAMVDGLRHLRLVDKNRWVWCDALCINQADDEEKAAQVQKMQLIFAKARKVIAWLGTLNRASRSVMLYASGPGAGPSPDDSPSATMEATAVYKTIIQRP
jgi:hypothetical protein